MGLAERAFGADDALRDRGFGHQVGAGDLVGRQAAQKLQRERDARVGGQHGMAGSEDQPQEVVADLVGTGRVERVNEIRHDQRLLGLEVLADLVQLGLQHLVAAQPVECAILGRGHEPGAGLVRHALGGPMLQGGDQRVLRQFLGHSDVAHHARNTGHDLRGLDAPDGRRWHGAWPSALAIRPGAVSRWGPCTSAPRHGRRDR